ncbi:MAG: lysylphosphatidylglycerol synthase transmembrane domain-containing protein [Candidatus Nanohalobium sp.]
MDLDSSKLWFGVSTAVILVMIYIADISKFISAIRSADTVLLIPAYVTGLLVFVVYSAVWHRFFRKMKLDLRFYDTIRMFMAGHFMNSITPLGQFGGEPFMAYIVNKNSDASYEKAFSAVLSADLVNAVPGFTFLLGGVAYLLFLGSIKDIVIQLAFIGVISAVIIGLFVYLLWFKSGTVEKMILRFLDRITSVIGRGKHLVKSAEERFERTEKAFKSIGEDPKHLLGTILISHITFVLQTLCLYYTLRAVGILDPTFTSIYFILVLSSLASYSPTPGGSGTFEAAMAGMITTFIGADFAVGLVAAIIFRTTTYWPGILIGYFALNTLNGGRRE